VRGSGWSLVNGESSLVESHLRCKETMKRQEKAQLVNVYRTRVTPRILCCMQMKKAQLVSLTRATSRKPCAKEGAARPLDG
jgi:hypothetical protein